MRAPAFLFNLRRLPLGWVLAWIGAPAALLSRSALADMPPPPPPPPPPPAYPAGVLVELRADNPGTRIDRAAFGGVGSPVCVAPCRLVLDRQVSYVIQGEGITATSPFLLPEASNQVTLDVRAGSQARRHVGAALLAGAAVVTLIGFARMSLGGTFDDAQGRRNQQNGLIMMGIGIPAAVVGLVLYRTARTWVTSSTGTTFTQDRPSPRARSGIALTPRGLVF